MSKFFGHLPGLGSYDNPNEILIHKHALAQYLSGVSVSFQHLAPPPTTYVGSWALVVSTIDFQILFQFLCIPSKGLGSSHQILTRLWHRPRHCKVLTLMTHHQPQHCSCLLAGRNEQFFKLPSLWQWHHRNSSTLSHDLPWAWIHLGSFL